MNFRDKVLVVLTTAVVCLTVITAILWKREFDDRAFICVMVHNEKMTADLLRSLTGGPAR